MLNSSILKKAFPLCVPFLPEEREHLSLIVRGLPLAHVREWLPPAPARVCVSSEEQAIPLVPRPGEGSNYIRNASVGKNLWLYKCVFLI